MPPPLSRLLLLLRRLMRLWRLRLRLRALLLPGILYDADDDDVNNNENETATERTIAIIDVIICGP